MRWYTRPVDQGQIVEVSYAYDGENGQAYKRERDGSDGTTVYYVGALDWDREPEGVSHDRAPCVESWEPCAEPEVDNG